MISLGEQEMHKNILIWKLSLFFLFILHFWYPVKAYSTELPIIAFELLWENYHNYNGEGEFNFPNGVAIDPNTGDIFVTDEKNHRVQKFDSEGNFILEWGSKGSQNGQFRFPVGIYVDHSGDVYIADTGNNRIQVFDSKGIFLYQFGSGILNRPKDVTANEINGNVYVADTENNRIVKFDAYGDFLAEFGSDRLRRPFGIAIDSKNQCVYVANTASCQLIKYDLDNNFISIIIRGGDEENELRWPRDVTTDSEGNLYIADTDHDCVKKFDAMGNLLFIWRGIFGINNPPFHPRGVAVNLLTGDIFVTASYTHHVYRFNSEGDFLLGWGSHQDAPGNFNEPTGIAVDSNTGNVYVADGANFRTQKFDPKGNFVSKWGHCPRFGDDQAMWPQGIAIHSTGNIYIVTSQRPRDSTVTGQGFVKVYDKNGNFLFEWGGLPCFGLTPQGIAIDYLNNNVYVADTPNNRIKKFDSDGNFILEWGNTGTADSQFQKPTRLAIDEEGSVYVSDTRNHRVQKFDSQGNFILKWGEFGSNNGQFKSPCSIAIDYFGRIYVADVDNNRIQIFDSKGSFIAKWSKGTKIFKQPISITIGADSSIYVLERGANRVQKFKILQDWKGDFDNDGDVDGSDLAIFTAAFGSTSSGLNYNSQCDFDADGDVDGSDLAVFAKHYGKIVINLN